MFKLTIAGYCTQKGLSNEEYNSFNNNIINTAKAIRSTLHYNGGMYYSVSDLFNWNADADIKCLIINELKKMNIEFFDNDTLYRVID